MHSTEREASLYRGIALEGTRYFWLGQGTELPGYYRPVPRTPLLFSVTLNLRANLGSNPGEMGHGGEAMVRRVYGHLG